MRFGNFNRVVSITMASFTAEQAEKYPEHAEVYAEFGKLHSEKLWFELTEAIFAFVSNPKNGKGDNFVQLYTNFVCVFADDINQLRLVQILGRAVQQQCPNGTVEEFAAGHQRYVDLCDVEKLVLESNRLAEEVRRKKQKEKEDAALPVAVRKRNEKKKKAAEEAAKKEGGEAKKADEEEEEDPILQVEKQKGTKLGDEARFVLEMETAVMLLRQNLQDRAKVLLDHGDKILSSLDCADPFVHASLYRAKSEYYKQIGPAEKFFHNALRMSAYTPPDALSAEEQVAFARELSLSAITGEGIYNFGEVVALPAFESLAGREDCEWLMKLMISFKSGNMTEFNDVRTKYAKDIASEPILAANDSRIRQKIALLCLMELIFNRSPEDRSVTFEQVATAAQIPVDEVDLLLIRAMSVGLIKGTIDDVDQILRVTWLKPRVLDRAQIGAMATRFANWRTAVQQTSVLVNNNAADVFA